MSEPETKNETSSGQSALNVGLAALSVKHPYYCSESNYYSNDAAVTWETMTDFLAAFESCDVDMNLVFRWDIKQRDEKNPGRYYAEVFMMHQRKGIFSPHHIKHINEEEAIRFKGYLEKHWETLTALWQPLSANAALVAAAPDLLAALEKLAKLGNEPHYGNSIGNQIARDAIAAVMGHNINYAPKQD